METAMGSAIWNISEFQNCIEASARLRRVLMNSSSCSEGTPESHCPPIVCGRVTYWRISWKSLVHDAFDKLQRRFVLLDRPRCGIS
jgi:hypothetical protein